MTVKGKGGRPRVGTKKDPLAIRNFSLLESHIRWLLRQPGGASATLRKLVDRAMQRDRRKR